MISSLADPLLRQPTVVSIGNFDGVHWGHRAILGSVTRRAQELGVRSAVMTFDPHPLRVLAPDRAPRLITTLQQKIALIGELGIDLLFVARFDRDFAALAPEAFITRYLVDGFQALSVCVGANFNFGYRQSGTVETLRQWKKHFELIEVAPVSVRSVPVSSTAIRERIAEGSVDWARRLLGRCYEIVGRIVPGEGRGRQMTVPTLNLETENEVVPQRGVYITRVSMDDAPYVDAVTNIGIRPTFGPGAETIETHVLSGAVPSPATTARLQFLRRLRDERRFDSAAALRAQISEDARRARRFFHLLRRAQSHALSHSG
ncbi:MAG TPA: bifunctional riboflavin kinase/FAD synthetase [Terriglobia bacterium]|nr:bifunctional riboflavin kinase/FAD synthetase [Terriglobia bacterium]